MLAKKAFSRKKYVDYFTGGMQMPGRTYVSSNYRYGHNGQEKDDEIFQGAYTAEFWEYDSRTLRRWERDPIVKPWESPYACFNGNPIFYADPLGLDGEGPNGECSGDARINSKGNTEIYGKNGITGKMEWTEFSNGDDVAPNSSSSNLTAASTPAAIPNINTRHDGAVTYNKTTKVDHSSGATQALMGTAGVLLGDDATGVGVADDPLLIPVGIGLVGTLAYDAIKNRDKTDVITTPVTITDNDPRKKITLYRGVGSTHPDYPNALKGTATPLGNNWDPEAHAGGNTKISIFTSWSLSRGVASRHALMHSGTGVVLVKEFYIDEAIPSPNDDFDELEMLVPGVVNGAQVTSPLKPK